MTIREIWAESRFLAIKLGDSLIFIWNQKATYQQIGAFATLELYLNTLYQTAILQTKKMMYNHWKINNSQDVMGGDESGNWTHWFDKIKNLIILALETRKLYVIMK